MSNLNKYISDHREEFDETEPDPGHFGRFGARLDSLPAAAKQATGRFAMLRIAALILLLITVSVFLFDLATREIREKFIPGKQAEELPDEIRDALQYYDNRTTADLGTIDRLVAEHRGGGTAGETARQELRKLDDATTGLTRMLAADPGNQRILDAIVQNQQMKDAVLKTIINQLSQVKLK